MPWARVVAGPPMAWQCVHGDHGRDFLVGTWGGFRYLPIPKCEDHPSDRSGW